jgi:DNA-binding PadR family transcriptional regulator
MYLDTRNKEGNMPAYAIHAEEGGYGGDVYGLRALARAMTGRGRESKGRGRHRHRGYGPGGSLGGFPFGGFGPGGGPWRGRKARRGDVRSAALLLLAEEPRNGYQIMQEIEERSGGMWSPSPGSVYPALAQLEDEGLIRAEETDGRKLLRLTDAGRKQVEERGTDRPAPWEEMSGDAGGQVQELVQTLRATAIAATQVVRTGSETQVVEAQKILVAARRELYRLLAEEGEEEGGR